jgi:triacylglycerol lipase
LKTFTKVYKPLNEYGVILRSSTHLKIMANLVDHPVVLVHGIKDTGAKMQRIADRLQQLGRSTYSIDLYPKNGSLELQLLAEQLRGFIDRNIGSTAPFDLVGFSMGGLVSRYYVQRLGGLERVQRYVTISAPHQGTIAAHFGWGLGIAQMRPQSDFLRDLDRDVEMLSKLEFTSIWTPFDLIILPANSSQLPVGRDISLPILAHPLMVYDRRSLAAILEALGH